MFSHDGREVIIKNAEDTMHVLTTNTNLTLANSTSTEIGNSKWSLRFCATGHPYDPTPPHCPSSKMILGDPFGNTPLTPGFTFEYPGSGSGNIGLYNQ